MSKNTHPTNPFRNLPTLEWLAEQHLNQRPPAGTTLNNAGGYAFPLDRWSLLDRFLVLGTEGGTFYVRPIALALDNALNLLACLEEDGLRVVTRLVEISEAGRAPKQDATLFALALAAGRGTPEVQKAALAALPRVARTGTHLYQFLGYVEQFRGWGRGLRRAVGDWYNTRPAGQLAYQAVKYQQRYGWTHRDALRLAHPKAPTTSHDFLYRWITQGWPEALPLESDDPALSLLVGFERVRQAVEERQVVAAIEQYRLPWEAVPAQWLGSADVWAALLPGLPTTALVRNLARLTANGLLAEGNWAEKYVLERLGDGETLRKARLHPVGVLAALIAYSADRSQDHSAPSRSRLDYTPLPAIVDALDAAFYTTFQHITPTNQRMLLALDVSGSMSMGWVAGISGLTPRAASAAMALVTAATEPNYGIVSFQDEIVPLNVSPTDRLDAVIKATDDLPFGSTDCAQPMLWALKNRIAVDAFVVYTDSETWFGKVHPVEALAWYREQTGIPAKLVVVGMVSSGFSIADPNDPGTLDVVGFDTVTPTFISDFVRGDNLVGGGTVEAVLE